MSYSVLLADEAILYDFPWFSKAILHNSKAAFLRSQHSPPKNLTHFMVYVYFFLMGEKGSWSLNQEEVNEINFISHSVTINYLKDV